MSNNLNSIREQLERFVIMKSLIDGSKYRIKNKKNKIEIFKDDKVYLLIEDVSILDIYLEKDFYLHVLDYDEVDILYKKYGVRSFLSTNHLEDIVDFMENYLVNI